MRASRWRQSADRSSRVRNMRGESASVRVARMPGNSARRKRSPCSTAIPRSNKPLDVLNADFYQKISSYPPPRALGRLHGPEHKLQSEAGYIDARPLTIQSLDLEICPIADLVRGLKFIERAAQDRLRPMHFDPRVERFDNDAGCDFRTGTSAQRRIEHAALARSDWPLRSAPSPTRFQCFRSDADGRAQCAPLSWRTKIERLISAQKSHPDQPREAHHA
jgi:hypothetical protein